MGRCPVPLEARPNKIVATAGTVSLQVLCPIPWLALVFPSRGLIATRVPVHFTSLLYGRTERLYAVAVMDKLISLTHDSSAEKHSTIWRWATATGWDFSNPFFQEIDNAPQVVKHMLNMLDLIIIE